MTGNPANPPVLGVPELTGTVEIMNWPFRFVVPRKVTIETGVLDCTDIVPRNGAARFVKSWFTKAACCAPAASCNVAWFPLLSVRVRLAAVDPGFAIATP